MSDLPRVDITELLEAGVHFGHRKSRWNPKMAPYIYGTRDDIHIINLKQTVSLMQIALQEIYNTVKKGGKVLFVSTKIQSSDIIAEYIEKCGQYYVNNRWLGGTLTNWATISRSIKTLDNIEKLLEDEDLKSKYTKKEILNFERQKNKLNMSLGGIRQLKKLPDLIVIIDTNKEHLAITEARKLGIPMVAIVDTNSDPDNIAFPIPGNDDSMRAIKLYCQLFCDAVLKGTQDALVQSGVDIGSIDQDHNSNSKVVKIKQSKKLSKAVTETEDQDDTKSDSEENSF